MTTDEMMADVIDVALQGSFPALPFLQRDWYRILLLKKIPNFQRSRNAGQIIDGVCRWVNKWRCETFYDKGVPIVWSDYA